MISHLNKETITELNKDIVCCLEQTLEASPSSYWKKQKTTGIADEVSKNS